MMIRNYIRLCVVAFCFLMGCPNATTATPLSSPTTSATKQIAVPDFVNVARINIEGKTYESYETKVDVRVEVVQDSGDDLPHGEFILKHDRFKGTKWAPLAIDVYGTYDRDHKMYDVFGETLDFLSHEQSADEIFFVNRFVRGAADFTSLWRIKPKARWNEKANAWVGYAVAEICIDFEEKDKHYTCTGVWKEIKQFLAVPTRLAIAQAGYILAMRKLGYKYDERKTDDISALKIEVVDPVTGKLGQASVPLKNP
jgi:hypothetical protein